jgi:hypothetical protein
MKNEQLPAIEIKIKQPPVLFTKTQALIAQLAQRLGGPLVAYWNGPRGSVCHTDVVALYDVLERLGRVEVIYLFLKSDGGSGQAPDLNQNRQAGTPTHELQRLGGWKTPHMAKRYAHVALEGLQDAASQLDTFTGVRCGYAEGRKGPAR